MVSVDIDNYNHNYNYNNNYNHNHNNNDGNDEHNFGGNKFGEETEYFNSSVYDINGNYLGCVIAESYSNFFLNTGEKDNNGVPIGSFIHKDKENIEWFMNYEH